MQVLVVIDAAHGCEHDGCGPVDGELAVTLTMRMGSHGGAVREIDHVLGIETGHLAPAAEVVDIDVAREVVVDSFYEALARRGGGDDPELAVLAEVLAGTMLAVAGKHPVGTILSHGDDGRYLVPTVPGAPAPPARRPVCAQPRRAR
jgi:hypothetical protein